MNDRVFKTTSILAVGALVSRVLGFARDMIIARMFGATAAVDAYFAANKVLTSFRGFLEGPLSNIFVPILGEYKKKYPHSEVKHLFAAVAGTVGFCVSIGVIVSVYSAPYLLKIWAPGLDLFRFKLAVSFLQVTFPYLLLLSFCGLGVAVMNSYERPWGVSITPIWLSISLITWAYFLSPYFSIPITALAWGFLCGGILQFFFVIAFLRHLDLLAMPKVNFQDPGVRQIIQRIFPVMLGASASQISLLINTNLASFLPTGTISCIQYADRLVYFPLSIIGISLSTALLKPLSQYHAEHNLNAFKKTLGWGLRLNLLAAIPSAIAAGMLSGPMVVTLFMEGEFTATDMLKTRYALLGYVGGISAFMMMKTFTSAFYARKDTRTPMIASVLGVLANILVGLTLTHRIGLIGITLASSVNSWIQICCMVFWLGIPISQLFNSPQEMRRWFLKLASMAFTIAAFLYCVTPPLEVWIQWTPMYRKLALSAIMAVILAIAGVTAHYSQDFKQSPQVS